MAMPESSEKASFTNPFGLQPKKLYYIVQTNGHAEIFRERLFYKSVWILAREGAANDWIHDDTRQVMRRS